MEAQVKQVPATPFADEAEQDPFPDQGAWQPERQRALTAGRTGLPQACSLLAKVS